MDHIVEADFAGNFHVSREVLRRHGVLAVYATGGAIGKVVHEVAEGA